jgi:hypothetical protein
LDITAGVLAYPSRRPDARGAGLTMVVVSFFDEPSLQMLEPEEPEPQRTP